MELIIYETETQLINNELNINKTNKNSDLVNYNTILNILNLTYFHRIHFSSENENVLKLVVKDDVIYKNIMTEQIVYFYNLIEEIV